MARGRSSTTTVFLHGKIWLKNRQNEHPTLALVHYQANRALDHNTDEEAYVWLELMIQNVERSTGDIITY